jgi:hypothetical protein
MSILLALALAAPNPDPLITAWADCMTAYARPRLATHSAEEIVTGGFAACPEPEEAVRRSYLRQSPAYGQGAFETLKRGVREIMIKRVTQAQQGTLPAN